LAKAEAGLVEKAAAVRTLEKAATGSGAGGAVEREEDRLPRLGAVEMLAGGAKARWRGRRAVAKAALRSAVAALW
jgi:hypothetical protein